MSFLSILFSKIQSQNEILIKLITVCSKRLWKVGELNELSALMNTQQMRFDYFVIYRKILLRTNS